MSLQQLRTLALIVGVCLAMTSDARAGDIYSCTFDKAGWSRDDWTFVRRPDLVQELAEDWVQGADFIENNNPTHTSMVYAKALKGDLTVQCTMSFRDAMAPSIIIASELGRNEKGQTEYRRHFEIVLYNRGVNVWSHRLEDGKSRWTKTAFWEFPLEKDTKYRMSVALKAGQILITVGDRTFGYVEPNLPAQYHLGITGEEGINRFYDFKISE